MSGNPGPMRLRLFKPCDMLEKERLAVANQFFLFITIAYGRPFFESFRVS
jgi:hypothetical protein